MSQSEEKLLILKMLEEGKISSEEAARLLEALNEKDETYQNEQQGSGQQYRHPNFQDEVHKVHERIHEWKKDMNKKYNDADFDRMVDDFSKKAEKLGKNLANTTAGIVDKAIDFIGSFVDTNAFNIFGSYQVVEKSFEAAAAEGMDLYIEGVNGPIQVKKHLDNKIVIKSRVRSPQNTADNILVFEDYGNSVSLKVNKIANLSVSHEIYLPAVKMGNIKFETNNAKIYIEDTVSKTFTATTKNGHIELMGVNGDAMHVSTRNARIQMSYVIGRKIDINTTNSAVDIRHIKTENINALTTNGKINVENVQNYEGFDNMNLILKTTNSSIKVNMNDMESRAYKVKARTTNGSINLLVPEIIYHHLNRQGKIGQFVEAESSSYVSHPLKVDIDAETANGYIEIVK